MASPAKKVSDYLAAQGHGTVGAVTGWAIATSKGYDAPDTMIVVADAGTAGYLDDAGDVVEHVVHLTIRSKTFADAFTKIGGIFTSMRSVDIHADIRSAELTNGPIYAGSDDQGREIITASFKLFAVL